MEGAKINSDWTERTNQSYFLKLNFCAIFSFFSLEYTKCGQKEKSPKKCKYLPFLADTISANIGDRRVAVIIIIIVKIHIRDKIGGCVCGGGREDGRGDGGRKNER